MGWGVRDGENVEPGARIEETGVRSTAIEPADTSVTAMLGASREGPADEPVEVESLTAFDRVYGRRRGSSLHRAARDFFANGGRRAITVRVTDGPASLAVLTGHDWQLLVVDPAVADLAEAHALCVRHRAFLVCDATADGTAPDPLGANAAAYFPPLATGPCAPAVAGVFARTDATRGVWTAPAGSRATLVGTVSREPTSREIDELAGHRVNALRTLPGAGTVVWGARTTSPDPEWRYVPVRRLVLFLERSIERGLQWAVFEPNDEPLWARVRQSVTNLVFDLWRRGALAGTTADDAFFVRCDRSTMTRADIESGRLVVLIGVAPTRPAEFVVIRVGVRTAGAS